MKNYQHYIEVPGKVHYSTMSALMTSEKPGKSVKLFFFWRIVY